MRFYLLVIFILNSFILCAQTTTTSFLTNNDSLLKDQKGFDYIYALCFAKNENLAIASNYGLYQFNGATITKKYNNKKDYITFHQHGNSNWTLPFDDYIREVDHPETALPFLKNNPYKCLAAYEDKSGNSHFLINSKC